MLFSGNRHFPGAGFKQQTVRDLIQQVRVHRVVVEQRYPVLQRFAAFAQFSKLMARNGKFVLRRPPGDQAPIAKQKTVPEIAADRAADCR